MGQTRLGGIRIAPAAAVVPETSSHRTMAGGDFRFKIEVSRFRLGSDPLTSNFALPLKGRDHGEDGDLSQLRVREVGPQSGDVDDAGSGFRPGRCARISRTFPVA